MPGLLVVTASPATAEALIPTLRRQGYEVAQAANGEHALRLATASVPDAILLDAGLPPMERWHTVRRLSSELLAAVPVWTFSDVTSPQGLERLVEKLQRGLATPSVDDRTTPRAEVSPVTRSHVHKILVVDDSPMNRDTLSRRLERKGYEVHSVPSGEEALVALARSRPLFDLVVLDWMMPGLSGLDVLRRIRETWTPIVLPVIMATARAEADDVVEALQAQANDYVTKPLNFEVLHARMKAHLALADLHRALQLSEQRYRNLVENTGDMIVQFRYPGPILYVSPASLALLGREPAALQKRPFLEWLHPQDRRALEDQLRRSGGWPAALSFLARMEREDGTWIWVETSTRAVRDGAHTVVQTACRDVTDHMERMGEEQSSPPFFETSEPDPEPAEPPGNAGPPAAPVVLTLMMGDFDSVSHEELAARVGDELRRALGAKLQ